MIFPYFYLSSAIYYYLKVLAQIVNIENAEVFEFCCFFDVFWNKSFQKSADWFDNGGQVRLRHCFYCVWFIIMWINEENTIRKTQGIYNYFLTVFTTVQSGVTEPTEEMGEIAQMGTFIVTPLNQIILMKVTDNDAKLQLSTRKGLPTGVKRKR